MIQMFKSRWWIVVASFLALIVGTGAVQVFVTGVFLKPISESLHLGRGVISHESALALHALADVNPSRIHLTVPRDNHPRAAGGE